MLANNVNLQIVTNMALQYSKISKLTRIFRLEVVDNELMVSRARNFSRNFNSYVRSVQTNEFLFTNPWGHAVFIEDTVRVCKLSFHLVCRIGRGFISEIYDTCTYQYRLRP